MSEKFQELIKNSFIDMNLSEKEEFFKEFEKTTFLIPFVDDEEFFRECFDDSTKFYSKLGSLFNDYNFLPVYISEENIIYFNNLSFLKFDYKNIYDLLIINEFIEGIAINYNSSPYCYVPVEDFLEFQITKEFTD